MFDRFVEPEATGTRYCLVMEYAEYGDLATWLDAKGAQPEKFVRQGYVDISHLRPLRPDVEVIWRETE